MKTNYQIHSEFAKPVLAASPGRQAHRDSATGKVGRVTLRARHVANRACELIGGFWAGSAARTE